MKSNGLALTLRGIKRVANKAKKAARLAGVDMTHRQALEQTAQLAGYSSYEEAFKALGGDDV